jgi:RimJ/RimL family protein N-acetyltransferase
MSYLLTTPRLAFREMTRDDLTFLAAMVGDPEVMRYFPEPLRSQGPEAWLERQLSRYARDGHGAWLVLDRGTEEPLGQAGLIRQEIERQPVMEIGYMFHRPFWRRGYASEAAAAIRDQAFGERGLDEVVSLIVADNEPSIGVARKIGMRPRREVDFHGFRHVLFGLTRAELAGARPPAPAP